MRGDGSPAGQERVSAGAANMLIVALTLRESRPMMETLRILIANGPRSYREVIAAAVQALRPHIGVSTSEPDDLDGELARFKPHLVVCSQLTEPVRRAASAWVVLYPDGANHALLSVAGQQRTVADLQFDDLLAVVDQTAALAQLS